MDNNQKEMEHSGEHEVIGLLLAQTNGTGSSSHLTTLTSAGEDSGNDHINSENGHTTSVNVQAVTFSDGSTAFIQHSPGKEGFQAVQLEDGTTAYIAQTTADSLFEGNVDHSSLNLEFTTQGDLSASPSRISARALALGEKAFRCSYEGCDRLYTTQHHLKVHERSHTGERPFKCNLTGCGKAFATGYGLKSHTRVHTGEKPYKCPEETCDKAFKTSGDLQKHVRTHTGERPFKCPFEGCDRCFTTSNILKVHIRTHTGERPYICQEDGCARSFASATNYKNHVRIHTGEKPYVCTVQGCGKRFTEYSSLYKHHVVHTHSKPYTCNHCGKNYRQTSTLAMHIRTAHGVVDCSEEGDVTLHQSVQDQDENTGETPDKRARIHYENEGIHAQQITMITASDVADDATIAALQAAHQAVEQQNGDETQQILVVSDPSQLVALQLAQPDVSSVGKNSPMTCSLTWTEASTGTSQHLESTVLISGTQ